MTSGTVDLDKVKLNPKDQAFIKKLDAAAERMRTQATAPKKQAHWLLRLKLWQWLLIVLIATATEILIMHLTGLGY
jgi:hypothetical protein